MGKIYLPLLFCLFLFASCSHRFVTQEIKDKTSNYVVDDQGKHINTMSLKLRGDSVITDTGSYPLTNVSAIKRGPAYYGVKNGDLYDCFYYGKLMVLGRYMGTVYNPQNKSFGSLYYYYLQKQDAPEIVNLTDKNLIESVRDNPLALRKAKASRIFSNVSIIAGITTVAGLSCIFLSDSSPIRKPAVTIGLFSMPTFLITLPIASHKRYKAIVVYNR